tara:strand:- start:44 stop:619 length:576 start_codon:yes stop_codon:yes gene_type:complete
MNMLYYFVVDLPKVANDEIEFADTTLKIDTKFNEFEHRVTQGEVVSTPHKFPTDVKPGDTLFFHHLVVINGGMPLEGYEGKYLVSYDPELALNSHAFAYQPQGTEEVYPLSTWSILSPCFEDDLESEVFEVITLEKKLPTRGVVAFDSENLKELGVKKGDTVGFKENRDYRFKIQGEEYYRTRCEDLMYVV